MKWIYKNITISVENDGNFYFFHNGNRNVVATLTSAKEKIDRLTEKYYRFTETDMSKMLRKLDNRERDFIIQIMKELERHADNAHCSIGISDEVLFTWLLKQR